MGGKKAKTTPKQDGGQSKRAGDVVVKGRENADPSMAQNQEKRKKNFHSEKR